MYGRTKCIVTDIGEGSYGENSQRITASEIIETSSGFFLSKLNVLGAYERKGSTNKGKVNDTSLELNRKKF